MALAVLLLTAGAAPAQVFTARGAWATFEPEGLEPARAFVTLPHAWDAAFPGRDGRAHYEFQVPSPAGGGPYALYFPRVGNQVEIRVDGKLVHQRGQLGDADLDTAKAPLWLLLPRDPSSQALPSLVQVSVSVQSGRWGGLAAPVFGPQDQVYPMYRHRYVWRQLGSVAVVFCMALMALLAGGLWWMQRDPLYGVFAIGAALGSLRFADRLLETPPLPWPLWGAVAASALAVHVLLMVRFALAIVTGDTPQLRRGVWVFIAVEVALALCAFMLGKPVVWTVALGLLAIPTWGAFYVVIRQAWLLRTREALAVATASLVLLLAGFRDYLVVRVADDGVGATSWLPLASMLFVLLMGWVVVDRYARHAREYRGLLASLDQKVAERERELSASYELLQQEHEQRAALLERQRIMRDIHDGVGAQLVGLLSLLGQGGTPRRALQEQASAALDELRMAVDAMQPVHGDLATVLATLRYRLQPRLQAAGIELVWQVDALPRMDSLTPQMVLQIQRILLEAFTNVLRHAGATRVTVAARHEPEPVDLLCLTLDDNGAGLPAGSPQGGQGLNNMRLRAQAIGAQLTLGASPEGGLRVALQLPLQVPPT